MLAAFKSRQTQGGYLIKFRMLFEFCSVGPDEFVDAAKRNTRRAEELVTSYILSRRGAVSGSTIRNFVMALKLLLAMNDAERLNWVRLGKIVAPAKKHGSDRAPEMLDPHSAEHYRFVDLDSAKYDNVKI